MGRVIAIDYGRKRCGVAVTDPLQICANGLPTVRTCDLMAFLKDYNLHNPLDCIVIGLPKTLDGQPSESQRYINPFINQLKKELPSVPIERFDERFTSSIAHREMVVAGLKKSRREDKALADKTAAVIILTDWLNSKKSIL